MAAAGSILFVLFLLHLLNPDVGQFYGDFESKFYVRSVTEPLTDPINPHAGYRLIPPVLVGLLPLEPEVGFIIVDYVSLFLAAYFLFRILCAESLEPPTALVGSILFLTFPNSTKWLLAYSSGPDAFYLFLIAAGYRCIQTRRIFLFSLILSIGALTKVTLLVLVPVAAVYVYEKRGAVREALRWAMTAVPAMVLFLAVRAIWPATDTGYTIAGNIQRTMTMKLLKDSTLLPGLPQVFEVPMAFLVVFGVVAITLIYFWRSTLRALGAHKAMAVFLLLTAFTSAIGSFDSARTQMYAAIPVVYLFGLTVDDRREFFGRRHVLVVLGTLQIYLSNLFLFDVRDYARYMPHYMRPDTAARYLVAWLAAIVLLSLMWRRHRHAGTRFVQ